MIRHISGEILDPVEKTALDKILIRYQDEVVIPNKSAPKIMWRSSPRNVARSCLYMSLKYAYIPSGCHRPQTVHEGE